MAGRKENESVSQFVSLFVCFSKTKDLASLKRTRLSINHDMHIRTTNFRFWLQICIKSAENDCLAFVGSCWTKVRHKACCDGERRPRTAHTHTPVLMSASVGSISLLPYLTAKNKRKPESVQRERR